MFLSNTATASSILAIAGINMHGNLSALGDVEYLATSATYILYRIVSSPPIRKIQGSASRPVEADTRIVASKSGWLSLFIAYLLSVQCVTF